MSLVDRVGNYGIDLFGSDRALIGRQSFKTSGRQLSGLVSFDRRIHSAVEIKHFFQRLSVTLQRGNAALLLDRDIEPLSQ